MSSLPPTQDAMTTTRFQPNAMPGYTLPVYPYRSPPELTGTAPPLYPVVIAGGGLGGLTAALELATHNIPVVVLDEDDTVGAAGLSSRGICYAQRSLEILDRFGVAERIRAKGITWNEGDVYRGEMHLYRFDLQPERGAKFPAFINLQQFYVEQYLVESIAQQTNIDLRWKNRLTSATQHTDHVHIEVTTPEGAYSLKAQYLIGADGAHSVVREHIGARDAESSLFEDYWCIADVRMQPTMQAVRKAYLDNPLNDGGAIWYHQMADGIWRTDWQISHYQDPDQEATPERAIERLKKLLPDTPFELVWVGPWRFRKRYLERMRYGRVFFLGDASAQHSPFGARGGNRAIQDANNLGWKLALVLQGKANDTLLETYHTERHAAARENVELASRSAIFIGPETDGQRLCRDAILDLAQHHIWARAWVNTGRLSVGTHYTQSPLNNTQMSQHTGPLPGAVAPDATTNNGFFTEKLQGQFSVIWFGCEQQPSDWQPPAHINVYAQTIAANQHAMLFERYGVNQQATYVFRPDGHVLACFDGIETTKASEAITSALNPNLNATTPTTKQSANQMNELARDRLYDAFADAIDRTPPAERERMLSRLAISLMQTSANPEQAMQSIAQASASAPQNNLTVERSPA